MPFDWLFTQPEFFVAWLCAILVILTTHEFSHALAATLLGDSTAKNSGRLTLNPISHIDPLGFLMLLLAGFGWAKPVPVNPYNFKNQRVDMALVSLAGPGANLLGLIVFGLVYRLLSPVLAAGNLLVVFLQMLVLINACLLVFNLIPIPPLDGSKVLFALLPDKYADFKNKFSVNGPFILIGLIILDSVLNLGIFASLFNLMIRLISFLF